MDEVLFQGLWEDARDSATKGLTIIFQVVSDCIKNDANGTSAGMDYCSNSSSREYL